MKKKNKIIKKIFRSFIYLFSYFYFFTYKYKILKFRTLSEMLSMYPGALGLHLRRKFYNLSLKKCGENLTVGFGTIFSYPDAELGNDINIEDFSVISKCVIGNKVTIASNVSLMSGAHHHGISRIDIPIIDQLGTLKTIYIGDDVWIGTRSVIMNDVGNGSVIGAGSVVTKPIPEYSIAAGVPARVIKTRK